MLHWCVAFLLGTSVAYVYNTTDISCDVGHLTEQFTIEQLNTYRQYISSWLVEQGTILNVKCKSSGIISWTLCQNGIWIINDKQCLKRKLIRIEKKQRIKRRKRFLNSIVEFFRSIGCLFTRCSSPAPRDSSAPVIGNCPDSINEESIPIQTYAFISWTPPSAWDDIDGQIGITLNGRKPGGPFFEGQTTIGYSAKDNSGNMATCKFIVTIWVVRCSPLASEITNGYRICHPSVDMVKGTVCNYGCYHGHELKGGPSQIECMANGEWSANKEPYCEKKKCQEILVYDEMSFSCTDGFNFRSICTFRCIDGFDIPSWMQRTKVCLESGKWNSEDPYCIDIQPPKFQECYDSFLFFPDDNKDNVTVFWEIPKVIDNKDKHLTPHHVSGPPPFSVQEVNTYTVAYEANDNAGNVAKPCSFNVVVKQLRCQRLYPLPYMKLTCTGTRRGSHCSFSCNENAVLNGTHTAYCLKADKLPYAKWNMESHPFCQVSGGCMNITAPKFGALACDVWLGGQLCHPSCSQGYSVLVSHPLPSLIICTKDGTWLHQEKITDCVSRVVSKRRLAKMSVEFYFNGDCNNPEVQLEIKETFITVVGSSDSWSSKCTKPECHIGNVMVLCGSTTRKRSVDKLQIEIYVHFESKNETLTSEKYETEVSTFSSLLKIMETELVTSNTVFLKNESLKMVYTAIKSEGLHVECLNNSVPVFDTYVGCVACPAGSYFNKTSRNCNDCPRGFYQPSTAQNYCEKCPVRTTTAGTKSISVSDCEDACLPGTWSSTGLPPCVECDIGFYEDSYGSIYCKKCPGNRITIREGINNISGCYDFDIVFPNINEESYTILDFEVPKINMPFYLNFHIKVDPKSFGSIVRLSTSNFDILHINTTGITIQGKYQMYPDAIVISRKWHNIVVAIANISTAYVDGKMICTYDSVDFPVLTNVTITLGNGFSGSLSNLNIMTQTDYYSNSRIVTKCDSETFRLGLVNWNDFAYSSLINSFIDIPSKCDDNDDCYSNPCINGNCTDKQGGYTCVCSLGFTGKQCNANIDDCIAHACQNNATCFDIVNGYLCTCKYGYTGLLCEVSMVDGGWSAWDNWTECSVSCGNGTQQRRRSCSNPQPDNGGNFCEGSDSETEVCSLAACKNCKELIPTNHSSLTCSNILEMTKCTQVCDDGYWYDSDVKMEYICGNETFFDWDFQTVDNPYARLPVCNAIMESRTIEVDYMAYYDLFECNRTIQDPLNTLVENKVHIHLNTITCIRNGLCNLEHIEIINCDHTRRHRRYIEVSVLGFVATLKCNTTRYGTEDCYLGLGRAVAEIKLIEVDKKLDFKFDSQTFQIVPNSSTSDSRLSCPLGAVPVIAFCVPCSVGHFYSMDECLPCPIGKYQDKTGQTFCHPCPAGTTTLGRSSIDVYDCNVALQEDSNVRYVVGVITTVAVVLTVIIGMILYKRYKRRNETYAFQDCTMNSDESRKPNLIQIMYFKNTAHNSDNHVDSPIGCDDKSIQQ